MFKTYIQNNSGGTFVIDDDRGICETVIIEGNSSEECDSLAEQIGLYFDGNGDCPCCGDRWNTYGDCYDTPSYYGTKLNIDLRELKDPKPMFSRNCWIHYLDGSRKKIGIQF